MAVLTRTAKERFTDFIAREAKKQGLKVVVNGSFTGLSFWDNVSAAVFDSPLDPNLSKPVGMVVKQGKQIAGSSSEGKFYFSQNVCGTDSFESGQGNPPLSSCAAVGGLAPILVNGLQYGAINMYSSGGPVGAPVKGNVDPKDEKYLLQKSNAMFTQLLGRGASVGKVAVGYSTSKHKLLLIVQADGDSLDVDVEKIRTVFVHEAMENAVFMDCSNSASLWYDGKFDVKPQAQGRISGCSCWIQMRARALVGYSIPACVLMFCWLTMGVSFLDDKELLDAYGFPLSWYVPSIISSSGYEIAIGHLLFDLGVYAVLTHFALVVLMTRVSMSRSALGLLKGLLWFAAAASLFLSVAAFSIDPHATWWTLRPTAPKNAQKRYFVSLGLQPRTTQIKEQ